MHFNVETPESSRCNSCPTYARHLTMPHIYFFFCQRDNPKATSVSNSVSLEWKLKNIILRQFHASSFEWRAKEVAFPPLWQP